MGSVNSSAHVDEVGKIFTELNLKLGRGSNPNGGMSSAPEKKESTSPSDAPG